jgi:hypothetical protein
MSDVIREANFGQVLEHLKASPIGNSAYREGWNGKGMFIKLQVPDENSKMGRPYIYMSPVDGKLVPWLASQTDLLSEDWCLFTE